MKLPYEYQKNLKNKIITKQMFIDAVYSVNKRAKNCRDKIREYKNSWPYHYHTIDVISYYEDKKDKYYNIKEELLSYVTPTCIHKEFKYFERIRIYDYQKEFSKIDPELIVWRNCYWDSDKQETVEFVDIEDTNNPVYFYYYFYDFGEHSFHQPLLDFPEGDIFKVIEIDSLITFGEDVKELLSMTFVNKVLDLLKTGNKIIDVET